MLTHYNNYWIHIRLFFRELYDFFGLITSLVDSCKLFIKFVVVLVLNTLPGVSIQTNSGESPALKTASRKRSGQG